VKEKGIKRSGVALIVVLILLVVVCIPIMWSCAPAPEPTEPIELIFSSWGTTRDPAIPAWEEMGKDLEEATGGQVTMTIHHAEALGKAKEHYELAKEGVADIAYLNTCFTPGRFPITDLASYTSAPSGEIYTKGMLELMKQGYMDKEYADVKVLFVYSGTPNHFFWREEAPSSLEGFQGKKIRVPSGAGAKIIEAIGATPVAIPMPEVYTAMERGVIDAAWTSLCTLEVFRMVDVTSSITECNMLTFGFAILMNQDSWDKLPAEAKALLENNAEKYALMATNGHDSSDAAAVELDKPIINKLSAEDMITLREAQGVVLKDYLDEYEAAYQAKEAADLYYQTLKGLGVEPFALPAE